MANDFTFSEHACQRAEERFPHLSKNMLTFILSKSQIARSGTKKLIRKKCPVSANIFHSNGFKDRYHLYHFKHDIVFVVSSKKNEIVTVFPLR